MTKNTLPQHSCHSDNTDVSLKQKISLKTCPFDSHLVPRSPYASKTQKATNTVVVLSDAKGPELHGKEARFSFAKNNGQQGNFGISP